MRLLVTFDSEDAAFIELNSVVQSESVDFSGMTWLEAIDDTRESAGGVHLHIANKNGLTGSPQRDTISV